LQELILKTGYWAKITRRRHISILDGRTIKGIEYSLYIAKTRKHLCIERKRMVKQIPYKGRVYCAEVPTHAMVIRRNGKPLICGNSCTATGSLSALQDDLYVIRNEVCDLSIQDLFFGSGGSCEGGNTMEATLDYLRDKGVALTEDCPYQPELGDNSNKKPDWYLRGKRILSWSYCEDPTLMKEALNQAPIVTTMMVHQSFLNYVEGIYESQGVFDPVLGGHCVEVIGCSDSQGFWKGKNSWARWGMANSVFQIRYGDSEFDECMYIIVPNGPIPPPEPQPSPCPVGNAVAKLLNLLCRLLGRRGRFQYVENPKT
jgi:hypothetical protein